MNDTFRTVQSLSSGIYKDKGSRFLAFALPVSDVDTIKEILKDYRKQYHDARHVCFAYQIGTENQQSRSSDDGEPSGTAGKPILGQILSARLTDILIIVVRYFGGVLLGTGGLVEAYRTAAAEAIANAEIVEKAVEILLTLHFDYLQMNEIMKTVKGFDLKIVSQKFETACEMTVSVPKSLFDTVKNNIYAKNSW